MTILERVYASGGPEVIIPTIELTCSAWAEPILICAGFEDQVCTTEDVRTLTFVAAGIDVALPKKGNSGNQTLTFAIDNVSGEAQAKIDAALEAEERVTLIYRTYLSSDLSGPAEPPYYMTVLGGTITGTQVQIDAGYFDAINTGWPRDLYTLQFAPGLRYL
ncbi:DUF1833 family protein [Azotobacter chroococcum]|uniref:DUF1833 family protein n=1 Tax=Azotobacter chroococcum TaxID=353 RepID=UPI0010AEDD58|nr:DUF1833 family protein [Azotobacter chroococcum]TKD32602.1 DUF1833 domain-containing protein [Azotobacter chroococcum]